MLGHAYLDTDRVARLFGAQALGQPIQELLLL
jgi:hypothetical protein